MKNEPDYGWRNVVLIGEALMAASLAGGAAMLLALILGLV